jgi:hypothetical protein
MRINSEKKLRMSLTVRWKNFNMRRNLKYLRIRKTRKSSHLTTLKRWKRIFKKCIKPASKLDNPSNRLLEMPNNLEKTEENKGVNIKRIDSNQEDLELILLLYNQMIGL